MTDQPTDKIPLTVGPRDPLHPAITKPLIRDLVMTFYDRIRADDILGPIFNREIQDNWPAHLARMCTFWESIALKTGGYKGKPVPKHMALPDLEPSHFSHWLELFRQTAFDVCGEEIAPFLIERAERIAESLQLAIFFKDRIAAPGAFKNGALQPTQNDRLQD